jgi:hypothetical protein
MSGVNAHMVISMPNRPHSPQQQPHLVHWDVQRHWPIPTPHVLLHQPVALPGGMRFVCDLSSPALACLWDHIVSRRALMVGTGMLEMAVASTAALASATYNSAILNTAFVAACVLPRNRHESVLLECVVSAKQGTGEICSRAGPSSTMHVSYRVGSLPSQQYAPSCVGSARGHGGGLPALIMAQVHRAVSTQLHGDSCASVAGSNADASGFYVPPTVSDSCLHLSALTSVALDGDGPVSAPRVPVSAAAYSSSRHRASTADAGGWASVAVSNSQVCYYEACLAP